MKEIDKQKILLLITGYLNPIDFESWVFKETDLEKRIELELYHDLISLNYAEKDIIDSVKKIIVDKHIELEEVKYFQLNKMFEEAKVSTNNSLEKNIEFFNLTQLEKKAAEIISEYSGIVLTKKVSANYWTPKNIEFLSEIHSSINVNDFIQFAYIDDCNSSLYIDIENYYYQLDNISSLSLYKFKEKDFKKLMINILGFDEKDRFEIVGRKIEA